MCSSLEVPDTTKCWDIYRVVGDTNFRSSWFPGQEYEIILCWVSTLELAGLLKLIGHYANWNTVTDP